MRLPDDVRWPTLPPLGSSLVIGTEPHDACRALRLKDTLRMMTGQPRIDLGGHGAVLLGRDELLFKLGKRDAKIGPALALMNCPFVIGPAFSTWWEWSPFDSLVAVSRSAALAAGLARYLPTIPALVWRNGADLARLTEWIVTTRIPAVAVDLATLRSDATWGWAMNSLRLLATLLARDGGETHLVVNGPSTVARLGDVRSSWPGSLTFASQNPWQTAMGGRRLMDDLQACPDEACEPFELAVLNRNTFDRVARRVASNGHVRPIRTAS